ncbi:hypothetical protein J4Q44_G00291030 [Coregonus suidteri]|uniref:Immunoglobulin domain-containing protein n=1 Tax=Coregonus suidteri TaxID=861788 RepID=A0AAN8L495_9TELE
MRILLIVILLSFMTGCLSSFKVTGYSGGTVIIYCDYSIKERSSEKYFCMGEDNDCCEKSVTETVYLGGEATISCNYPEDHEDSIKYFCKEDSESDCKYKISGTYNEKLERYYISKKRREKFYSVTISDLTEDDTGTYWCGETSRTEDRYIALITQVKLRWYK